MPDYYIKSYDYLTKTMHQDAVVADHLQQAIDRFQARDGCHAGCRQLRVVRDLRDFVLSVIPPEQKDGG